MSIDQFLTSCKLEYCIEYQKVLQYKKPEDYAVFCAGKKLDTYIYNKLAGEKNKLIRQKIAEKITGGKVSLYRSGVHDLQKLILEHIKL